MELSNLARGRLRRAVVAATAGVILAGTGVSAATPPASPTPSAKSQPPKNGPCKALHLNVPPFVAGFPLTEENPCSDLGTTQHPSAINTINLYSLRRPDKLLLATLQISRFRPGVDGASAHVRDDVRAQIGETVPELLEVDGTTVELTRTRGVSLLVWFRGSYLFVLSARDVYSEPRLLLRKMLEITP